jgi:AraC-like DNA-binding protein
MRGSSVAIGVVNGLLSFAEAAGLQSDALCGKVGIDPETLSDPDGRLPLQSYKNLMHLATEATNDPALALHFGAAIGMSDISIVGLLMEASNTIGDAYTQLRRYGRLAIESEGISDGPRFDLVEEQGRLFLVDHQRFAEDFPELTEVAFAWLVCGPRRYLDRSPVIKATFTWPKPQYWRQYEQVLQCPVEFGAKRSALEMHSDSLTWPVKQNTDYVFGILEERAETLLDELRSANTAAGRVKLMLAPSLHEGDASAASIARQMGISRQTLFRWLKDEGTDYSSVVNSLRCDLAKQYLQGSGVSLSEVAYLVGFSEGASFTRAFKRWTGVTPSEYRRRAVS